MKKILFLIQNSFLFLFVLFFVTLFLFFQKDVVPFLAQKYLKEFDVTYSSIEGTLFRGVEVRDFAYQESIKAKKLTIKYAFLALLQPTPRLALVEAEDVFVDLDALLAPSDTNTSFALNISEAKLSGVTLRFKGEEFLLDANATHISYKEMLDIEKLNIKAQTRYASGSVEAQVKEDVLKGEASLHLSNEIEKKYLDFVRYEPKKLLVDFILDAEKITLKSNLSHIIFKEHQELSLKDASLDFSYFFEDANASLTTEYKMRYKEYDAKIKQRLFLDANLDITSQIDAKMNDGNIFPFETLHIDLDHNARGTHAHASAKEIEVDVTTKDFETFLIDANTRYAKADATLRRKDGEHLIESDILFSKEFLDYKGYDLSRFSKLSLTLHEKNEEIALYAKSDKVWIFLNGDKKKARGYGAFANSFYDYRIDLEQKSATLKTKITSLASFAKEFGISFAPTSLDANVEATSEINFAETLEVATRVDLPSYRLTLDSKNEFVGQDAMVEFLYRQDEIKIQKYRLDVRHYPLFSERTSTLLLKEDGEIKLQEFWIFDSVRLEGVIDTEQFHADLLCKSERFVYDTPDANLTLKFDLRLDVDLQKQRIDGEVEILDGVVMYKPRKAYTLGDEDIIIIQDISMREKQEQNRELNVILKASKPIAYKTKDVSVMVVPDLFISQKLGEPLEVFGLVSIQNGQVTLSEKVFEFDASELYFYGGKEINPHLNLNLHYQTLDYIDIEVYVTNKMSSPLLLFSSKPAMSQEDILSYILFGESASSVFETSQGASKTSLNTLLLGTGLKKMINDTSSVNFDTLNILTNKEGTLGYEIGARLNKKIRLVYKNDAISSLILQYSLSKSLRLDVDIKETGQGVNIIYVKDFALHTP